LQELMNQLIECKTRAQQKQAIAGEKEWDYIKTIARHEKEIPQRDHEIKQLREDITSTPNSAKENAKRPRELRNDFTRQQNELAELRAIVNQIRNNWRPCKHSMDG
jgi:chromosome segregation ATPase